MTRKTTGILGEKLANRFLVERGYQIIETNYRCRDGEIDIVASKDDCLVFVEVRTKRSRLFGTPEESITTTKKEHLRAVANRYRETHTGLPPSWRIDLVAVELGKTGQPQRIELIENAIEDE
ncbi:MAG TPA: YraN family protein [Dehalococcoidales bacterium]